MNTTNIDDQKRIIRKEIKLLKQDYSMQQRKEMSIPILEKLEELPEFKLAKTVMLYWSMKDEVFSHEFVCKWAKEKKVILPCVKGQTLDLKVFRDVDSLVDGENYGIPEPDGPVFMAEDEIDLILIPGVAFDKENNRMGRGKAYYDRLLQSLSAFKVGICFDFQVLDQVPIDQHDIKMDHVVY
ncbi:5-formyltetrahydrofolate cyclo-ligase [Marinifilum caeruleilacunae]|uniref:5-formyltetrahydrofolate cyclo-ligase n=1 Tax=Marinifilum caeruleilacunae TaxID=2499076 RepID=A0ABX1WYN7_9BACT|nr:5-formyltetrahydrofolate cyclo-ligase [Marinifilum caeruleilacunae]NOU61009.1 5-formyltetrahydrofolate cyclo-ligase [Marinifilum caeruleilacunae]